MFVTKLIYTNIGPAIGIRNGDNACWMAKHYQNAELVGSKMHKVPVVIEL
jgi:hypothetical protein